MSKDLLRLGTRGSPLAMWQAEYVRDRLMQAHPGLAVEIIQVKSHGDVDLKTPLIHMGQVGIFTKTIELELTEGRIDVAVHSLKDVPALLAEGTHMAAYPPREDPRDAWFQKDGHGVDDIRQGAKIATGSLRRRCQLMTRRSDLEMVPLRGNLNSRWEKYLAGDFDAMLLAAAGVIRLGWADRVTQYLEIETMLPAVCQGILGLQVREGDIAGEWLAPLNDPATESRARAERALLEGVAGGCVVPLAGYCEWKGEKLWLRGRLGEPDGSRLLKAEAEGDAGDPESLGHAVADQLLEQGGAEIVRAARQGEH